MLDVEWHWIGTDCIIDGPEKFYWVMILSFLSMFALIVAAISSDVCYEFPTSERYSPVSVCGAAVDYSFYLKSGTTLASLESEARLLLNDQRFVFSSTACLVNYKKLVCSNIYIKCQPGLIINDNSTYNKEIYSNHPVPFTRPCRQVAKHHYLAVISFVLEIDVDEYALNFTRSNSTGTAVQHYSSPLFCTLGLHECCAVMCRIVPTKLLGRCGLFGRGYIPLT